MASVFEQFPEMTDDLADFTFIAKKTQGFLTKHLRASSQGHEFSALCRSWKRATEAGAYLLEEKKVTFQVFEGAKEGVTLIATLVPNAMEDAEKPWFMQYVGVDKYGVLKDVAVADEPLPENEATTGGSEHQEEPEPEQTVAPASNAKDLKNYAFVWFGSGSTVYKDITELALPETWGFGEGDYSILYSYIVQTFYKLRRDGEVLENEERTFAAFNTGLVTPRYEDIFMCFKPNPRAGKQPWAYAGVCTRNDNNPERKPLSIQLRRSFRDMPKRARYFTDVSDIVYDATKEPVCNWEHIIIENVDRIPTDFIAANLFDVPDMRQLVESIDYDPDKGSEGDPFGDHAKGKAKEQFDELREFLETHPMHFNRLKAMMEGALDRARKRAEYSFRTGVPSFYPTINKIQMLLPLCLTNEDEPDCALVMAKDTWGGYEGMTILTLRMAYNNARLLCRPESDWLNV